MDFAAINLPAVLAAAIASFLFGGVWYGLFSRQWLVAANLTAPLSKSGWQANAVPFIITFAAQLLMAYTLAGVIGHLATDQVSLSSGVAAGAFVWAGFVMTTLVVNHTFQGARRALTAIDGGHWLGALVIQGAIIGWLGV